MSGNSARGAVTTMAVLGLLGLGLQHTALGATDPKSASGSSQGLEEIVVTAQKRSEDLQKTALAVSAVTGDTLKKAGVVDAQGLTDVVPGVEVGQNNSNTTFAIRGISSGTDATLGDAAVAFHLDGVFEGRPAAASGLFYDIQRVEVLRGPQGTLYGRNATAGAVNVVTNRPSFDGYQGDVAVETGSQSELRTEGMFNAPVNGEFALRLAAQTLRHGGYLSNGYDDADDHAARLQALWRPSNKVSLLVYGDYFHQGGVGKGLTELGRVTQCDLNPASPTYAQDCTINTAQDPGPWASWQTSNATNKGYLSPPGYTDNLSWSVHAELTLDLGPVVLTEIPAYHHLRVDYFALGNSLDNSQYEQEKETSNELRLSSNAESKAKWVLGAFYHDEEQPYKQIFYDNVAGGMGLGSCAGVGVPSVSGNPDCLMPGQGVSLVFPYPTISNPSYAAFGQITYPITAAWRVTAGIRWNHDHKNVVGETDRVYGVTLPPGSQDFPYTVPATTPFGSPNGDQYAGQTIYPGTTEVAIRSNADVTWTKTTWKVGLEHDLADNKLIYLNVSTGYKQGGVFSGLPPFNVYRPETITAYEFGSKNRFADNRLQVNADAFYYDYKDYQIDQLENLPAGGDPVNGYTYSFGDDIFNADLKEYGAELETLWAATSTDELGLNLALLHGQFGNSLFPIQANPARPQSTTIQMIALNGVTPSNAPQLTSTLSYRHTWPLNGGASMALMLMSHFESAQWLAVDHDVVTTGTTYNSATGVYTPNAALNSYAITSLTTKHYGSRQRAYSRSQLGLTYQTADKKFSVQGFIRNIENKAVMNTFSFGGDGAAYASVSPPRTYGLTFEARF
ncbi:MAG: TonB-dependent receptor [Gammaproteobacteria bacterium]|nr:TonB-dependent receptor [Gammaproteobacteria bacterium]